MLDTQIKKDRKERKTMNVTLDLSALSDESKIQLCRSFFYGPNGFFEYMSKPEVQQRYHDWLQERTSIAKSPKQKY